MDEELVGTVTHYFHKLGVGVVKLSATISLGDTLHFRGHTTDFTQKVESMEIDHAAVETAELGAELAIKVDERVRHGDVVYKVEA